MQPIELREKKTNLIGYILAGVLTFGIAIPVMLVQRRLFVRTFDQQGVTRKDGQTFRWQDLRKVNHVYRRSRYSYSQRLVNVELVFSNGRALVAPRGLANEKEVMAFLEQVATAPTDSG